MSMNEKRHGPRLLRGLIGYVLTLALTVVLTAACLLTLTNRLLTDRALHERVALDSQVIDAQMARVEETVAALAEQHHFAPETVLNIVSRESLEDYGRDMTAWWMGLLSGESAFEAPFPDTGAIEEAVRADELFRESTDEFMRRTIARDQIAYKVGETMRNAVMPVRLSLVTLAMPVLSSRGLTRIVSRLGTLPIILFGAAAVLLALILATQGKARLLYASVGPLAAFLLLAAATVIAAAANLPGAMAAFSPLLALQLGLLERALLPGILLAEGALLLLGALLLGLCLKKRHARYHGRHERSHA